VKVFANASAAAPPAVYFAKTFTDYSTFTRINGVRLD
jgi:hypothetical protein